MGDTSNLVLNWRSVMMAMVCLPIVICAVILWFRKTEDVAARYLAAFLFCAVLTVGPQIIGFAGFYDVWPGLTYFPLFYTELWLAGLLYLHADALMDGSSKRWKHWLLIPGVVQSIYYVWAFFGLGDYQQKWAYNRAVHEPYIVPVESVVEIGLFIFALVAIWRLIKKYRVFLENTNSAAMDFDQTWLRNIIVAFFAGSLLYSGLEVAEVAFDVSYYSAFPVQVLIMCIMAWFAIDAVWRINQPFPKYEKLLSQPEAPTVNIKDWSQEAKTLEERVLSEQWFLESRLSIRDLAARMQTNETYISKALNQGAGQSFNQYINSLRVKHAQSLIIESNDQILEIALKSGFNSKATFNRVFRTIAGMTPTQYKAQHSVEVKE